MTRWLFARRYVALLLLLASAPSAMGEERLGRLFYSPERRLMLDRQRELNQQPTQEEPEEPTFTINGLVVRSNGHKTIWIDGTAQHDEAMSAGISIGEKPHSAGEVVIGTTSGQRSRAHVGDTVVRGTGQATGMLNGGQVRVPRRPGNR